MLFASMINQSPTSIQRTYLWNFCQKSSTPNISAAQCSTYEVKKCNKMLKNRPIAQKYKIIYLKKLMSLPCFLKTGFVGSEDEVGEPLLLFCPSLVSSGSCNKNRLCKKLFSFITYLWAASFLGGFINSRFKHF